MKVCARMCVCVCFVCVRACMCEFVLRAWQRDCRVGRKKALNFPLPLCAALPCVAPCVLLLFPFFYSGTQAAAAAGSGAAAAGAGGGEM